MRQNWKPKWTIPQEDLSFESDEEIVETLNQIAQNARLTAQSYQQNRIRLHGAKVAILGPVNAGKSSLFNHLVGSKRAIVSDRPGTTRDIVERRVLIDGMEICFFDTAVQGLIALIQSKMKAYRWGFKLRKRLIYAYLVHPANQDLGVIVDLQQEINHVPSILVLTHIDLVDVFIEADCMVSNKSGSGLEELLLKIRTVLGLNKISETNHVSLSQRQQSLFQSIADHVEVSAEALNGFLGPAVATEEITLALKPLQNYVGMMLERLCSISCFLSFVLENDVKTQD